MPNWRKQERLDASVERTGSGTTRLGRRGWSTPGREAALRRQVAGRQGRPTRRRKPTSADASSESVQSECTATIVEIAKTPTDLESKMGFSHLAGSGQERA